MGAAGRAAAPLMRDVYKTIEDQYPIDRPTSGRQYVPPHLRNQVTMEELEIKNEMLEQARRQALMQITASQMAYETNVKQQIGPATQRLSDIDLSSPDAVNQILRVRNEYPMAFQDKEFYDTTVAPLVRVNEQYMKDMPKPKTEDEVMEDIIKARGQQKAILDSVGAKSLDDLRRKGDPVDVRLYERLNRQIDAMMGVSGGGGGGGGALDALDMLTGGTGVARPSVTPSPSMQTTAPQQTMPPSSAGTPSPRRRTGP